MNPHTRFHVDYRARQLHPASLSSSELFRLLEIQQLTYYKTCCLLLFQVFNYVLDFITDFLAGIFGRMDFDLFVRPCWLVFAPDCVYKIRGRSYQMTTTFLLDLLRKFLCISYKLLVYSLKPVIRGTSCQQCCINSNRFASLRLICRPSR